MRQMLLPLFILVSVFFFNFLSRVVFGPLLPTMTKDLGLSFAQAGSLFFFISIGFFPTLVLSGFLSKWLDHRRTIIISNAFLGLALIGISFSQSLWQIRLSLFALGMAAGPYLPSGVALLTEMIDAKYWGRALGIHETAPNVALLLAPLVAEIFLVYLSWRQVGLALGLAACLLVPIFMRLGPQSHLKGQAPNPKVMGNLALKPAIFGMVFLFALGASISLGTYTMLPLYLVSQKSMDVSQANFLIFYCRLPSLVMTLLAGWLNDRLGASKTLSLVLILAGIGLVCLAMVPSKWVWLVIAIQSPMASCFFLPALVLVAQMTSPDQRNLVISLCGAGGILVGAGAYPTILGWLGGMGFFNHAFVVLGISVTLLGFTFPRLFGLQKA